MKIRTDFVTNSSSSSFSVVLTVKTKNGKKVTWSRMAYETEDCVDYDYPGSIILPTVDNIGNTIVNNFGSTIRGMQCNFYSDVPEEKERIGRLMPGDRLWVSITPVPEHEWLTGPKQFTGVLFLLGEDGIVGRSSNPYNEKLYQFIRTNRNLLRVCGVVEKTQPKSEKKRKMISVRLDIEPVHPDRKYLLQNVADLAKFLADSIPNKRQAAGFRDRLCNAATDLEDIASISVKRTYEAWGEFASLMAENDRDLIACAEKVVNSEGEAQRAALVKMKECMNTPDSSRGDSFANGYSDIRYRWEGTDEELIQKAKLLVSGENVRSGYSGTEHREFDVASGEYREYALYDL